MIRPILRSTFAVTTVLMAISACGGDDPPTTGDTSVGRWPARPTSGTATTTVRTFAAATLALGEDGDAWKRLGYNLDGKVSTAESTDVCAPVSGQKSSLADGERGIDNAFGNKIVSYISSITSNPSKRMSDAIAGGSTTLILEVTGLSDDATQTAVGVTGKIFAGAKFDETGAKKPTFTKSDDWPVRDSLTPKASFANGYVLNGTWVSGDPTDVTVTLVFSGQSLSVTVHQAIITFAHSAPGEATNGIIAGVLKTSELETEIQKVAGSISSSFCPGSANADKLLQTIREASDFRVDASQPATAACDGISVALGFTAKEIGPVTRTQSDPVGKSPCP